MKRGSITLLKVAVFAIGLLVLMLSIFLLPSLANDAANINPEFSHLQYPVLFGLYVTLIPFFFALYQALKLLKYIEGNNTFSESAVNALGLIKHYASAIIILYLFGIIILGVKIALHPGVDRKNTRMYF